MNDIFEFLKDENASQVISIISVLLTIFIAVATTLIKAYSFIREKINKLVEMRKEKTVKFSAMGAIVEKRILFTMWQPVIFLFFSFSVCTSSYYI